MIHTIQSLQVILFAVPVVALLAIGGVILHRPVSIVDRRGFLVILIPLLLANTLAILAGRGELHMDWRTWLILGADLVLIAGAVRFSRGFQVYGLTPETVEQILVNVLREKGFTVETVSTEKRDLWGKTRNAHLLSAGKAGQMHRFWLTARFNEVLIRAERWADTKHLHQALPALRVEKVSYDFKAHAVGVLYIVLALVFAVLVWIFFFEPRFILID